MRHLALALVLLGFSSTARGQSVLQFDGPPPRNLMFISMDTLRRDHFGPYSELGLTPFFDQIAHRSVVVKDHHQCSDWTYDSMTCTVAGRLHTERGHIPKIYSPSPVPQGTPLLATWLGDAGFYSIVVSSNSWFSQAWGNVQGYDETYPGDSNGQRLIEFGLDKMQTALARGDGANGWFLHMHLIDPHSPYDPEAPFIEGLDELNPWPADLTDQGIHYNEAWGVYPGLSPKRKYLLESHLRRLYEADIRMTDSRVANAWTELRSAGLLDDTLVVFFNDHGEQFWEHDNQSHAWHLNSEENDGILMFWADNIVPMTWDRPTHSIDLVATVIDHFGIPRPPEITGIPIGLAPDDRPLYTQALARDGVVQAVIQGGYKMHFRWRDGYVSVYDRTVDPRERVDLFDPSNIDPQTRKLWSFLKPQVDALDALVGEFPVYPPGLP